MSEQQLFSSTKWLWLSHVLAADTPAYGGGNGLRVTHEKNLCAGDSCNAVHLELHSHLGSHVDAPLHFIAGGRSVESYAPEDWMFACPRLVELPLDGAELITPDMLDSVLPDTVLATDLLLIRSGFEQYRGEERFWKNGPGLAKTLAPWLRMKFPSLMAVGVDFISISSMQHREEGRAAHRAFLGAGIRLFEDLALSALLSRRLNRVIALPLRFSNADGAPCSVVGEVY